VYRRCQRHYIQIKLPTNFSYLEKEHFRNMHQWQHEKKDPN
jgi:hypothetical protein